jgi:NAD(P)-dependent dehydrogenase (short-subunit alcohol dehydrogenase family)
MAKIFITGSADGLGLLAARQLISKGHEVVLHARNDLRAEEAQKSVPAAARVLIGDLADITDTKALAGKVNALGTFDAVIYNAGVYQTGAQQLLQVNLLAPYMLTTLITRPKRLIYLSSGMHLSGNSKFTDKPSYSDTKLQVLMLAKAVARIYPEVLSNAVDPGWVPTKMGGAGAPDNLEKGYQTQVWLAVSDDPNAKVSGQYFYHQKPSRINPVADDVLLQDELLAHCERLTGVVLYPRLT